MRLHHLSLQAWGPFADPVDLVVDDLADEGLFLIHGPTGAGKTSLLDAICFAFYGQVPGVRGNRRLASDHAPGARPVATVELTASGRRIRVTRSPAFDRPKTRGQGVTSVPASVVLDEWADGQWHNRSTRAGEADAVVADVVGLGREQFSTVVMLPQGEFARFLRSGAEERRAVLERLFDVAGFTGVERWLAERRRALQGEVDRAEVELAGLVRRIADAVEPVPALPVDPGALDVVTAAELLTTLHEVSTRADTQAEQDDRAAADLDERWDCAGQLAGRQERYRAALADQARQRQEQPEYDRLADRADRAGRAAAAADVVKALVRARQALRQSEQEVGESASRAGWDTPPDLLAVQARRQALSAGGQALASAQQHADARRTAQERHTSERAAVETLAGAVSELEQRSTQLTDHQAQQRAEHTRLLALATTADARRRDLDAVIARLAQGEELRRTQAVVHARTEADQRATVAENDAHTAYNRLRGRQLDEMAAELASRLADGQPCPVCGSVDHPAPAPTADRVDPAEVEAAEQRWEAARADAAQARIELATARQAQRSIEAALGPDGADRDALTTEQAELTIAWQQADQATPQAEALAGDLTALDEELAALAAQLQPLREERAAAQGRADQAGRDAAERDVAEAAALAEHRTCPCGGQGELAEQHQRHEELVQAVDSLVAALAARDGAAATERAADQECRSRVEQLGFEDVAAAEAAMMPPAELSAVNDQVLAHRAAVLATSSTLEDPDLQAAGAEPAPDLAGLTTRRGQARLAAQHSALTARTIRQALAAVTARVTELTDLSARHQPLARELHATAALADAVAGLPPENTRRMSLTSFVLAGRLEQVVGFANERLRRMGDGRYQLEHTDERAAHGAKSGLGLVVVDGWTGSRREPQTLSGGESFMASLALALGLADAVRAENGGVDLQTLFVDEGFGSLDEDSLDDVLDVLDSLRDGGRSVGIVSHVTELRQRIPAQVVVTKTDTGSSVQVRGLTAGAADRGQPTG